MNKTITFSYCESLLHEGEVKKGLEPFCKNNNVKLKLTEHVGPLTTTVGGEMTGDEDVLNYIIKETTKWISNFKC